MNPFDKLIAAVGALIVAFIFGMLTYAHYAADEIATIKANYNAAYNAAVNAKNDAEKRAHDTETNWANRVAAAADKYEKDQDDQHTQDARTIAALRSDAVRLSVRTNRPAASGGPLPGAAGSASTSDGAGTETLAGSVAARLAGRYSDYNRVVDKLTLCQSVLATERAPAPAPEPKN